MRFATLIHAQELRAKVRDALAPTGIEVSEFTTVNALIGALESDTVAAILLGDDEERIVHWLQTLQSHTEDTVAVISIGDGGTAGMARALLHGADDYVFISEGVNQIMHRTMARVGAKLRQSRRRTWHLGAYKLDSAASSLTSPSAVVPLSPREFLLARMLMESRGRVVALERLCEGLCGRVDAAASRAVKQHAHTLRKKCELASDDAAARLRIESVYAKGYRFSL